MNLVRTAFPTTWVVDLPAVQAHVRSTETADNPYLTKLIARAQCTIEDRYGIAFTVSTFRLTLDEFPTAMGGRILIPRPPIKTLSEVKYIGSDGVEVTMTAADYQLDADASPARLYPPVSESWPTTQADVPAAVKITFDAGVEDPSTLDPRIEQAILVLIGYWYENREGGGEPWDTVDALMANARPQVDFDQ